jgi:AraC family transcriptional regulator
MNIYIKNMVCPRCISAVEQVFSGLGIKPLYVHLGEAHLKEPLAPEQLQRLDAELRQLGFELLEDARKKQIEKIKSLIIEQVHYKEDVRFSLPELLSNALHKEYSYLSKLFSETEGMTIEHFVILQRTEKVKELLAYNEMNLNEIAFKLDYSSVAHLSAQFKKVTGLTPTQFKAQGIRLRKPLDGIRG